MDPSLIGLLFIAKPFVICCNISNLLLVGMIFTHVSSTLFRFDAYPVGYIHNCDTLSWSMSILHFNSTIYITTRGVTDRGQIALLTN